MEHNTECQMQVGYKKECINGDYGCLCWAFALMCFRRFSQCVELKKQRRKTFDAEVW